MANSDYGAIPLTLAESTSEALNTKLGVTTGFKPSEWPEAIASIPTGGGGAGVAISLKNNYLMSDSGEKEYRSPIDANNYVEVSGDTVILHRNKSDYHLYIYTPLLTAGHLYTMSFESVSGTDGKFYVRTTNDITANPVIVSQVAQINDNSGLSITFIPQTDCYYGIALCRSEYNDISVTNPQLVDYSAKGVGISTEQVLTDGRISNRDYGTVNLDKNILGYDWAVVRIKKSGETSIALFDLSKLDGTNYIQYRYQDLSVYVTVRLSDSTLQCYDYGGAWDIIDADVSVFNGTLFNN